jgi:hypothetical protein
MRSAVVLLATLCLLSVLGAGALSAYALGR